MGKPGIGLLGNYVYSRSGSLTRYCIEVFVSSLVSWIHGPLGLLLRFGLYRFLTAKGSVSPLVEHGVELLNMKKMVFGAGVYLDSGVRLHASPAMIRLGAGTRVMRNAYLCTFVSNPREGEGIESGPNCWIGVSCVIASGQGGVYLGENVLIGPHSVIVSGDHEYNHYASESILNAEYSGKPIHIEKNVWIGANVVVLGGVNIGERAVVAAGAVVNCDVPAGAVFGGVPAKLLKCGEDMNQDRLIHGDV